MKKKISAGLVLAIVLILAAVTALAATLLWENYVVGLIHQEQQMGTYAGWAAADKEALISALVDMGYIEGGEKTEALFDEAATEAEKHTLADQVMLAFVEQNENIQDYTNVRYVSEISAEILTTAVMGSEDTWPAEKRVWWQRLANPHAGDGDDLLLVNPDREDITEKEAIAIAKKAVVDILNVPESVLESAQAVADLYVTEERPEYKRWLVTFSLFAEGSKTYVERWYDAIVDSGGNLIADPDMYFQSLEEKVADLYTNDESKEYPPVLALYNEYAEYEGSYEVGSRYLVREWSIESKAEYSQEVRPQVLAILESGNLGEITDTDARYPTPHGEIIASTQNAYGLPKEDDIPIDDARDLARLLVWNRYGLEEQTNMDNYGYYEYYDITNPDLPLWKFIFYPESFEGMSPVPVYKVTLNAYTGEAVTVERYDWKEIYDGAPFHSIWY